MKATTKLWIALAILIAATPLGLLVPVVVGADTAWGEWSAQELRALVGYLPARMAHLSDLWRAPLPDYALPGQERARLPALGGSYVLSALIGAAVAALVMILIGRVLVRRGK
jgi:hypothetical protein